MTSGLNFTRRLLLASAGSLFACSLVLAAESATAVLDAPKTNTATTPVPREGKWIDRHNAMNERVKKGDVDLVFIGDSITQGWEGAGKQAWESHYAKRKAVNLGIGGDRTQHVLWRLDNGNLENIQPKLAVIMIGTNNSNGEDNTVADIAAGVRAIVKKLRDTTPKTKILLLGIFPRGEKPNAQRGKILQVNQVIAKLDDGKNVFYKDIGPLFVNEGGILPKAIMPDFLHLAPQGYEMWAEAIEPDVKRLLGEK